MQITFRYTDQEYIRSRSAIKLVGVPQLKIMAVLAASLTPSILLAFLFPSFLNVMTAGTISSLMFGLIGFNLWHRKHETDEDEHALALTETSLQESHSHSKLEILWSQFEELTEDELDFKLRTNIDRYIVWPKRIFSAEQQDELRKICLAGFKSNNPETVQPVSLFKEHFQDNKSPPLKFTYDQIDLRRAALDELVLVETNKPVEALPAPKKKKNQIWASFVWLFIFVWSFLLFYSLMDYGIAIVTHLQTWVLLAILFLPFVLFYLAIRGMKNRNIKDLPKLPTDPTNLTLNKQGFAIGTPASTTFSDWRDVESFFENKSCYAFKTIGNLLRVIPKRIFLDESAAEKFLQTAIQLRRESLRSQVVTATAVESGNPYQPPTS